MTVDENRAPVTYTVAPGDVEAVVAERLCAIDAVQKVVDAGDLDALRQLFS